MGKIILKNFRDEVLNSIQILESSKHQLDMITELSKFSLVVADDINQLKFLEQNWDNWERAYEIANNLKFKTWPTDKKVVSNLKEDTKKARDNVKKNIKSCISNIYI